MAVIELYFNDLQSDFQKKLLDAIGKNDPSDMNWDVFPITVLEFDSD